VGRLLHHQLLLDRVWGDENFLNPDYVEVFVSRLRAKLERPGGPHYIETERGVGYRFVEPAVRPEPQRRCA
jgi:DNA-binding response OmpR family regulator